MTAKLHVIERRDAESSAWRDPPNDYAHQLLLREVALGMCLGGLHAIERTTGLDLFGGGCAILPARPVAPNDRGLAALRSAQVMTADEVAVFLRLDRKTVYDYAARGEIPCQRLGKRLLFSRAAIELWLGACSKGSSEGSSK